MIEVVVAWPPNEAAVKEAFNLEGSTPVFCWGKTLFNPHGAPISKPLLVHEMTHSLQQEEAGGVERWWDRYISDPTFRLEQEIPAFANQYVAFCQEVKDRNRRARYAHALACNLSGKLYNRLCTYSEAMRHVKGV